MKKFTVNYLKNICIYNGGTMENCFNESPEKDSYLVKEKHQVTVKLSELNEAIIDGFDLISEDNFISAIYDNDTKMVSLSGYYQYFSEEEANWYADQIGSDVVKF